MGGEESSHCCVCMRVCVWVGWGGGMCMRRLSRPYPCAQPGLAYMCMRVHSCACIRARALEPSACARQELWDRPQTPPANTKHPPPSQHKGLPARLSSCQKLPPATYLSPCKPPQRPWHAHADMRRMLAAWQEPRRPPPHTHSRPHRGVAPQPTPSASRRPLRPGPVAPLRALHVRVIATTWGDVGTHQMVVPGASSVMSAMYKSASRVHGGP